MEAENLVGITDNAPHPPPPPRRATPATPTPDESRVASPASGVNGMEPGSERGASGASFGR